MRSRYYNAAVTAALFFTILMTMATGVSAQRSARSIKKIQWQTSMTETGPHEYKLGIRDKKGVMKNYKASYVITAPSKRKYRARKNGTGDEWAYVEFPYDFGDFQSEKGTYHVAFYVNGVVIWRESFIFVNK